MGCDVGVYEPESRDAILGECASQQGGAILFLGCIGVTTGLAPLWTERRGRAAVDMFCEGRAAVILFESNAQRAQLRTLMLPVSAVELSRPFSPRGWSCPMPRRWPRQNAAAEAAKTRRADDTADDDARAHRQTRLRLLAQMPPPTRGESNYIQTLPKRHTTPAARRRRWRV